jgi:hypothetical protein
MPWWILLAWLKLLALDGDLARAEPKTLRYRVLPAAPRLSVPLGSGCRQSACVRSTLAPLYDVLSTIALELTYGTGQPMRADTHLDQRVGGQADIRKVTAADLIDEAAS